MIKKKSILKTMYPPTCHIFYLERNAFQAAYTAHPPRKGPTPGRYKGGRYVREVGTGDGARTGSIGARRQ